MKEKKIAELTIPYAENYGSVLQAYALKKFISAYNTEVDVINYMPKYLENRYPLIIFNGNTLQSCFKAFLASVANLGYHIIKKYRFARFRNKYIMVSTKRINQMSELECYDYIIVGGDQLWNTRITENNTAFFLEGIKHAKKIAYSVSMGYRDRTVDEIEFYREHINNFDSIYIRENYDVEFISTIFEDREHLGYVLDPVLLVDKKVWEGMCYKKIIKERYILVYMFNNDEKVIDLAKKVGKEKNMHVYIIRDSYRKYSKEGFSNIKKVGPIEFVNLFNDAEYIVTNSFHGTVFSIIFEKNFNCIPYKGTEGRMLSVLELLNLTSATREEVVELNYKKANEIIKKEREKAKNYMADALEEMS